jgi:hypothetical protein
MKLFTKLRTVRKPDIHHLADSDGYIPTCILNDACLPIEQAQMALKRQKEEEEKMRADKVTKEAHIACAHFQQVSRKRASNDVQTLQPNLSSGVLAHYDN